MKVQISVLPQQTVETISTMKCVALVSVECAVGAVSKVLAAAPCTNLETFCSNFHPL